jgi:multidrug resistance efflux pump
VVLLFLKFYSTLDGLTRRATQAMTVGKARRAQHLMACAQYERRSQLSSGVTITVEALDNAQRRADTAGANYQQAIAARDNAALNLKRTEVRWF